MCNSIKPVSTFISAFKRILVVQFLVFGLNFQWTELVHRIRDEVFRTRVIFFTLSLDVISKGGRRVHNEMGLSGGWGEVNFLCTPQDIAAYTRIQKLFYG